MRIISSVAQPPRCEIDPEDSNGESSIRKSISHAVIRPDLPQYQLRFFQCTGFNIVNDRTCSLGLHRARIYPGWFHAHPQSLTLGLVGG